MILGIFQNGEIEILLESFGGSLAVRNLIITVFALLLITSASLLIGWINTKLFRMLSRLFGFGIASFIVYKLTFVGTIHHELSHALGAWVTFAKVHKIRIFPRRTDKFVLGSVIWSPRGNLIIKSIQCTVTAYAPVLLGFLNSYLIYRYMQVSELSISGKLGCYYLLVSILIHSSMSKQDFKVAREGLIAVIAIVCLASIFIQ